MARILKERDVEIVVDCTGSIITFTKLKSSSVE